MGERTWASQSDRTSLRTKLHNPNLRQGCFECKRLQPRRAAVWQFLMKLNMHLLYNLVTYPREIKTCSPQDLYRAAALFTVAPGWKQPKAHHLVNEWTKGDIQTVENSATTPNKPGILHQGDTQKQYTKGQKPRHRGLHTTQFLLNDILDRAKQICSNRKQITDAQVGVGGMKMFHILILEVL